MAYTTINKSSVYFNTKLYTGTGSSNALTGVGFQPDWTWIKCRDDSHNHQVFDAVRGVYKRLRTDTTGAETSSNESLKSFDSDGFTLGTQTNVNQNSATYASWNWKANGAGSANTDGGINSTVSVNNTAGFSIVKYGTGTGSATTVGHGLNAKPNFIIVKPLGTIDTGGWIIGGDNIDSTYNNVLELNEATAKANDTSFNDTAPTSSVFSVGNNNTNRSGENYIAYCFVQKTGYSKFGSYTGNGNADGVFVYTGFKPSWLMIKRTNSTENWHIFDVKRNPTYPTSSSYGGMATRLMANLNNSSDLSQGGFEFLSNGLKMTTSWSGGNGSGDTFIYMCFGQSLVGSNNVPCTAR